MRVIGIDPGLRRTGWGVIDVAGSRTARSSLQATTWPNAWPISSLPSRA